MKNLLKRKGLKMSKPKQSKRKKEGKGGLAVTELSETGWPAEVVEIISGLGTREGGHQVRCKILEGPDAGKIMRRNVYGPVRVGDILMLTQTEIEATPIRGGRK